MLKQFILKIHLDGHYTTEDPRCPSYWKGSGCYDIDVPTSADFEIEVWAETEEQAKQFALDYGYQDASSTAELDTIQVEGIKLVKDLDDRDLEEAGVIEDSLDFKWKK